MITVAVAVAATLFGVYSTANRYTHEIEAMFYDGVYLKDQGYTQPGINSHLENSANAALGLAALLKNYPGLSGYTEQLLSSRRALLDSGSIEDKSLAYWQMNSSFLTLLLNARDVDLSEKDKEDARRFYSVFNGALSAVSDSKYNEKVNDHVGAQSALLRLIGYFLKASEPEPFRVLPISNAELSWLWE